MDIISVIQDSQKNVWMVLGLSISILFLGWILGVLLSRWIVVILNRTPVVRFAVRWLKLPDAELIFHRVRQITRALITLFALWSAWVTLNSHPDIAVFFLRVWQGAIILTQLSVVVFLVDLALIGLATYILIKAFGWIKAVFNVIDRNIEAESGRLLKGFKFQRVQIYSADQLTNFLLGVSRYIRYGVQLLLLIVYLACIFSVYPQTRGIVTDILQSIIQIVGGGWEAFVDYLPSLLNLILITIITRYGLKLIRLIFGEIEKGTITFFGFYPEWAIPTYQLLRFIVIALALVMAFPYLPGSSSPAFQGISVFIGLILSLGSTSLVANIVSGVVLTYTRAFHVGDRVQIADTVGDITDKGLLVTRIRTIKNVDITIPNSMVMSSHIINYSAVSQERGLILYTTVTLSYDIPWRLIHETLIKAAQATKGILDEPHPFVFQVGLGDFYASYEINAYTDQPNNMAVIYSELHQNIQDFCNEAGIEILSPHYNALRDGNPTTIPPDHRPKDYQAPPFQVKVSSSQK